MPVRPRHQFCGCAGPRPGLGIPHYDNQTHVTTPYASLLKARWPVRRLGTSSPRERTVERFSCALVLLGKFERDVDDHVFLTGDVPEFAAAAEDLVSGNLVALGRSLGV
jgi:hypothetical protein